MSSLIGDQRRTYPVYFIPRQARIFRFIPGDSAVLRTRLGKPNDTIVDEIAATLGRGELRVMETDMNQVKVRNEVGEEDVVPNTFLIPPYFSDADEDNLAPTPEQAGNVVQFRR